MQKRKIKKIKLKIYKIVELLKQKDIKMKRKSAFTLSEVLITLSIIGVISMLTIPSVMFNTEKRSSAVSLKRAIAVLDQAIDMSRSESRYQPIPKCYSSDNGGPDELKQCKELFLYLKDTMQVNRYCASNPVGGGCMPQYEADETTCSEWDSTSDKQAFITTDGFIYFTYTENAGASIIGVDLNGMRGPNKWGYDVFSLVLKGHSGIMQSYKPGGCERIEAGGIDGATLLRSSD